MTMTTISRSLQPHHHSKQTTPSSNPAGSDHHHNHTHLLHCNHNPQTTQSSPTTIDINNLFRPSASNPSINPNPNPNINPNINPIDPPPPSDPSSSSSNHQHHHLHHHPNTIPPPSFHSFNQHAHSIASLIREKRKQIAHSNTHPTPTPTPTPPPPPLQLQLYLQLSPNQSRQHLPLSLPSTPSASTLNLRSLDPPISSSPYHSRPSSTKSGSRTRTSTRIITHNLSELMMTNAGFDTLDSLPFSSSTSNSLPSSQTQTHTQAQAQPSQPPQNQSHLPSSLIDLLPNAYHSLDALDPALGEVVMTPTTEEWWAFGGISHQGRKFSINSSDLDGVNTTLSTHTIDEQSRDHQADDDDDDDDEDEADDNSDHTGVSSTDSDQCPSSSITQSPQPEPSSSVTTPDKHLEPCPNNSNLPNPSLPNRLVPLNICSVTSSSIPTSTSSNSPSFLISSIQSSPLEFSGGLISTEAEPTLALTSVNGIINVSSNSPAHLHHIQPIPSSPPPILTAMSSHSFGFSSDYSSPPPLTSTALLSSLLDKAPPISVSRPCSLLHDGIVRKSIDPRSYSAITSHRNLDSFVIHSTAGSGAYGIVKHAQEKGPDGEPFGPPLVIKYIIKQRILADCWKRHKVLGPVPIEIHVLDHLRRVNYRPSIITMARRYNEMKRTKGETDPIRTIPNRTELLETFTKEEDDLTLPSSAHQRTGHPNICGILDYFEDPDYYYLVMPRFGDGKDLFEHIEMSPDGLAMDEVRRIFGQIVDGVAFLHERNIVHRDLKDENVILDRDGNAQLIDFGSAAYVREGSKFETFSGTLDFAAPEVLKGIPHGGKEIDVWALGVVLYVLITGECPFWNPEEAAKGIQEGSRARKKLEEQLNRNRSSENSKGYEGSHGDKDQSDKKVETESNEDFGSILDLLLNCLNLDPSLRPSVELICWHKFFLGQGGWSTIESKEFPNLSSDPPSSSSCFP